MVTAEIRQVTGKMSIIYKDGGKAILYNQRTQLYYFIIGFQTLLDGSYTGASTSHGSTPSSAYINYLDKYEQDKIKSEEITCPEKIAKLEGTLHRSLMRFEETLREAGIDPFKSEAEKDATKKSIDR